MTKQTREEIMREDRLMRQGAYWAFETETDSAWAEYERTMALKRRKQEAELGPARSGRDEALGPWLAKAQRGEVGRGEFEEQAAPIQEAYRQTIGPALAEYRVLEKESRESYVHVTTAALGRLTEALLRADGARDRKLAELEGEG